MWGRLFSLCLSGLCLLLLVPGSLAACHFPKEIYQVQSGWRFMSPDYVMLDTNPHSWRKIRAEGERIHVEPMKEDGESAGGKTVTYHCIMDAGERTYIVMWQTEEITVFSCLAFVVHSPYVVQWKMTVPSRRKPTVCEAGDMVLVDSPMVYYEELEKLSIGSAEKVDCPLRGGYVITQWFDQDGNIGCETDTVPPLKLENACERGEGLFFLGGSEKCPTPHEKIPTDVPFNCLASWTKGKYEFMLINPQTPNGLLPCIRYPKDRSGRFILHVFLDGLCDSEDTVSESRKYATMTMALFMADGICSDDTPACELLDSQCEAKIAKTCRKSCKSCPENPGWANKHFPSKFHGTWLKDSNQLGKEKVIITDNAIEIPSLGNYRTMGETVCSRKAQAPYGLTEEAKEYSLIQTFTNGCSHRMTVLQIVDRSESVLSFRVSKSATVNWKTRMNEQEFKWQIMDGWGKWCMEVNYVLPGEDPKNPYRTDLTGWFNLVRDDPEGLAINCTLPDDLLEEFHMSVPAGGVACSGNLQLTDGILQMTHKDCTSTGQPKTQPSSINQDTESKFECLASFLGDHKRTYLVTRTPENSQNIANETFICWVFSTGQNFGKVQWFHVSDCDANSEAYAQRGYRKELASFQFKHEAVAIEPYRVSLANHHRPQSLLLITTTMMTFVIVVQNLYLLFFSLQ